MGSGTHRTVDGPDPAGSQGVAPWRGAWPSGLPDRRRAGGGQPLGRAVRDGCAGFRHRLLPTFGYDRPVYTLSHDILFAGPTGDFFKRTGFIPASHENADEALRAGGVVMVFPGGDYDVYRPSSQANKIDFDGRTGYVRAALNAGVPIVPSVSIGGQENQLFLSRGEWLAKAMRLEKLMRVKILPISLGFPFGLSMVLPVNLPLPTKIVTQVLPPIDIVAEFGEDPDVEPSRRTYPQRHAAGRRHTRGRRRLP